MYIEYLEDDNFYMSDRHGTVRLNVGLPRYLWRSIEKVFHPEGLRGNKLDYMARILDKKVTSKDFYIGDDPIIMTDRLLRERIIPDINYFRELYLESGDERWLKEITRILPESYIEHAEIYTDYASIRLLFLKIATNNVFSWEVEDAIQLFLEFVNYLPYNELIMYE